MVFLLETALQEGIPLHKLEHSLVSGYFWGKKYVCVDGEVREKTKTKVMINLLNEGEMFTKQTLNPTLRLMKKNKFCLK